MTPVGGQLIDASFGAVADCADRLGIERTRGRKSPGIQGDVSNVHPSGVRGLEMTGQQQLVPFAIKSYRYLRLSVVVVVAALMASVLLEVIHAGCWQESISAYYYTPTHAIFVGGLVAIGVALIAVKGSTDLEDALLNVAGVLAPIVAFVPTSPPHRADDACQATGFVGDNAKALIDNNLLSFAIGGVLAIILTFRIGRFVPGDRATASTDDQPQPMRRAEAEPEVDRDRVGHQRGAARGRPHLVLRLPRQLPRSRPRRARRAPCSAWSPS